MFHVFKGSKKKPTLDSTWPDRSRAQDRCTTLRKSDKDTQVWIEEGSDDAPKYRKPVKGPYTNYDPAQPRRVDGRRN